MFIYAAIIISIIGLIIATYTDLKERIVTNKLNFTLAGIGLLIYLIQSIVEQTPTPIILSTLGLIIGFSFGWGMWKIGVFAGGDVKLFMALGALNPLTPALIKTTIFTNSTMQVFPITLFLYSLIGFLPYGIIVVIYKLKKNKQFKEKLINEFKKRIIDGAKLAIIISSLSIILEVLQITQLVILPALIIFGLIPKYKKIIGAILAIIGIIISPTNFLEKTIITFIFIVFIYGTIKLMLSLRPLLETTIKIKDLKEGMIPSKTLYYEKGKVKEYSFSIKGIFEDAKKNKIESLKPKNIIISSTKARGLIESEIKELKKLSKSKKIGETIKIKDSMPFVPTMLIGYILCIILGDFWILFWWKKWKKDKPQLNLW